MNKKDMKKSNISAGAISDDSLENVSGGFKAMYSMGTHENGSPYQYAVIDLSKAEANKLNKQGYDFKAGLNDLGDISKKELNKIAGLLK